MIILRFCGLLNFLILLSPTPAYPIMGDVDTTISSLSQELTTTISPSSHELTTLASVQEIPITTVEQNSITSRPYVEESDKTMAPELTVTTALTDSVTDMSAIASAGPGITLSYTTPAVATELPAIMEQTVMEVDIQATESALTTVSTPVTVPATVTTPATLPDLTTSITTITSVDEHINEIFKQPDEANSVDVSVSTSAPLPETTTVTMAILGVDTNEILEHAGEKVPVMESATAQSPSSNVLVEATASPALDLIPTKLNENSVMQAVDEVDNVLSMSSNEDTTRMASSTDSKMDAGDKHVAPLDSHTESPKLQETKNELEPNGKSGGNAIATSFAVLSMAVLYVIV